MNLLTILIFYLLNIRCKEDLIEVQKVFFLENDFWCAAQEQINADKGYLYKVEFDLERSNDFTAGFVCFSNTSYTLKSTNLEYFVLQNNQLLNEYITSFFVSSENVKLLMRFRFSFTDKPIDFLDYYLGKYKTETQEYVTYKLLEKITGNKNSINLRSDVPDIYIKHIKNGVKRFLSMKPLKFNEYINFLNRKKEKLIKLENCANFNLYYFDNFLECLDNLEEFIKKLRYFNLQHDNISKSSTIMFFDITTTMKVSQFRERLYEKLNEHLKTWYEIKIYENWEQLLDECYMYIKNEILKNNIFFPIEGKYDINYYIEQLSKVICETVKEMQVELTTSNLKNKTFSLSEATYRLDVNLERMESSVMKDFFQSEYIHNYWSKLLGKEVQTLDDYAKVEKMVCDCYNMCVFIFNLYCKFNKKSCFSYCYCQPIFIDNYNLRIIDGIKIKFNWPAEFGQIKGFNNKEEEVIMMKDIDYFIDIVGSFFCPSEILKMKNIQEIEIISSDDEKNNKRFNINDFFRD